MNFTVNKNVFYFFMSYENLRRGVVSEKNYKQEKTISRKEKIIFSTSPFSANSENLFDYALKKIPFYIYLRLRLYWRYY